MGILIGIATTNNFYSLSAARPSTEFHESPHAPPPLAPYYPPKQPKPYTPAKRVVRREKGEEPQTYKPTTTPQPPPLKAQVDDDTESGNAEDSLETWDLHESNARCPSSLKVFVYEYPGMKDMVWHRHAENQRKQCAQGPCRTHFNGEHLLAQFTLEHVLYDFFRQSCIRTRNPDEADLFFVTHFGDILYRNTGRKNDPSPWERALLDLVERNDPTNWERTFNTSARYWQRRNGADHILVQPAPV